MNIEVNFGNSCNMKCSYCFVKKFKTDLIIKDKYIKDIADFLSNINIDHFRPVGGEPALKIKQIELFINSLKNKPKNMTIVTNGTRLEELSLFIAKMFFKYKINTTIAFSIDKIGYDSNRNIDLSDNLFQMIELKEKYNFINYSINRVISNQTEEEISELDNLAKQFNISIYSIPLTNEKHDILVDYKENNNQMKLCGAFCKSGLYFYKNEIYLCKLCKNVYNYGFLGTLLDNIEIILKNRNKYKGCLYEMLNGGIKC